MASELTRRDTLKYGAAAAALFALPEWAVPALAQGEVDVPFTDYPDTFAANPANGERRFLDLRKMDGLITPNDQFFFIQHYNRPEIDAATHKIKVSGLVKKPLELTLADLKAMPSAEIVNGYECSGNSPNAMQGLSSNGRFTGVRLRDVLKRAGVGDAAREVVFFGADRGKEDVVFRQQTFKIEQQFARSITLENAQKPEPMLVYALNGQPLSRNSGFPVRLVMPGWYGVANVKWLSEIHLQEGRFLGNFQARWYRTVRTVGGNGGETDPETQWVETEVTHLNLKSVIARVSKNGSAHTVRGWVLNDGTPLKSVEVKVDDGPWKPAVLDPANTKHSWKLFTYTWEGATPGPHTLVSRVTDVNGQVQPTVEDLARKKTFLENNSQMPRKVMIAWSMSRSFRLGRLAGIDVFVHPTFALLLVWVAVSSGLQGRTVGAAAEGVGLMLVLFGCIVLHELGHALMARRFGIATKDITLLPIGGMARLERMPERPVQEFLVALAGPAVTLLIAVTLFAWLRLSGDWRPLEAMSVARGGFVEQVMVANVALLLFNLLPAFPMDGGRVLRAILAARTDYVSATVRAASIGQGIAFLLALVGLFSNLFLVIVAFFVWIAAAEEAAAVQKRSALAGVTVRAAMMTQIQTLTLASTVGDAVELLLSGSQQDFPVLQRGALAGILTRQRLIGALASHGREAAVGPLMEECPTATPDELLEPMLTRFDATNTRSIAVVDESRLVGLVTLDNVGELLMVRAADHGGTVPPVS